MITVVGVTTAAVSKVSNVDIVYICRDWTGEIKPDLSEVGELRFFAPDKLPNNISPPVIKPLKAYIEKFVNDI